MTNDMLTEDDLDTLVAALEAWENKDFGAEVIGEVMSSMFTEKDDPIAKIRLEGERQKRREKSDRERAARKERSVLLRAKLLTIRNDRRVNRIEQAVSR